MFVVTVEFHTESGRVQAFREAVIQQAANSLEKEPTCRQFDVCVSDDEPTAVYLYELYDDASAFQRHLASEHFLKFDKLVRDWVTQKTVKCWTRIEPTA